MAYTMAGTWGSEDLRRVDPVTGMLTVLPTSVTVCALGTATPITLYTDETMASTATNPLATGVATDTAGIDAVGNVKFFAVPGKYTVVIDGKSFTEQVRPDITETGSGTLPTVKIFNYTAGIWPVRATVTTNLNQPVDWMGLNTNLAPVGTSWAQPIDTMYGG